MSGPFSVLPHATIWCPKGSYNSHFYSLGFNQDPRKGIAFEEFKHVHTQQKYDDRWKYVRKTVFFAFLACKEKDKKLLTVCLKLYLKPMAQDTEVI